MSNDTFIELALRGRVMADEIDDFIDQWHQSGGDEDLHTYLGMSEDEYSLWINDPSFLGTILAARSHNRPIFEAVNDNAEEVFQLAARSDDPAKVGLLRAWLEEQQHGA